MSLGDLAALLMSGLAIVVSMTVAHFSRKTARELAASSRQLAKDTAASQVKPLLGFNLWNYKTYIKLEMKNYGLGPAVIARAKITSSDGVHSSLNRHIHRDKRSTWEVYDFPNHGDAYLEAAGSIDLFHANCDTTSVLERYMTELNSVRIEIEYRDVYGNPQSTAIRDVASS